MRDKNLEAKLLIVCKDFGLCCTEEVSEERANEYGVTRAGRSAGKYLQNALMIERAATEKAFYRLVFLKTDSSAHYGLAGMSATECYTLKELKTLLDGMIIASRVLSTVQYRKLMKPNSGSIDIDSAESWRRQAICWRAGGPPGCAVVGSQVLLARAHRCELRADALEQGLQPSLNGYTTGDYGFVVPT